jgi:branched-chain amino acid transport system ATP-binding protein
MLAIASQIILCLVLAALLGLIIGYLLGKMNCPRTTYKSDTPNDPYTQDDDGRGEGFEKSKKSSGSSNNKPTTSSSETQGLLSKQRSSAAKEATKASSKTTVATTKKTNKTAKSTTLASSDTKVGKAAKAKSAKTGKTTTKKTATKTTESRNKSTAKTKLAKKSAGTKGSSASSKAPATAKPKAAKQTKKSIAVKAPSDGDKPASLLSVPRGGKKDNLTRIKGIGIKIDQLLNKTGVYHFDQIAAWSAKEAAWVDHKVSFPGRSKRDDWIGQAKMLAAGKETEFSKRVDAGKVSSSKK